MMQKLANSKCFYALCHAALSLVTWNRSATERGEAFNRSSDHEANRERRQAKRFDNEKQLDGQAVSGMKKRIETLSQKGPDEGLKDSIRFWLVYSSRYRLR